MFHNITIKDGLPTNDFYAVVKDDNNHLWLSGKTAIYSIDRDSLTSFIKGNKRSVNAVRFDTLDGMKSSRCTSGSQSSVTKSADGTIYFSTKKGVDAVSADTAQSRKVKPIIHIEKVVADEKVIKDKNIVLSPETNFITFYFSALAFKDSSKTEYYYKLEGLDNKWVNTGNEKHAIFAFIPRGDFVFKVKAKNSEGIWSNISQVGFKKNSHSLETFSFYAAICCGVLLFIYILLIINRKRSDRQFQQLINDKTEELEAVSEELQNVKQELKQKYETSKLDQDIANTYIEQLKKIMIDEKLYRDSSLTLKMVAKKIDISPHNLSQLINVHLGLNFYGFVNNYRVNEVKENLLSSKYKDQNILSIAFDAGFKSKSSFNIFFKKSVGVTPSKYRLDADKVMNEQA